MYKKTRCKIYFLKRDTRIQPTAKLRHLGDSPRRRVFLLKITHMYTHLYREWLLGVGISTGTIIKGNW